MDKQDIRPILTIPEISYPEYLVEDLKSISNRLVDSLKKNPIDLNSGYLPFDIGELKFPSNVNFSMFEWIVDSNSIFQNLNMTLHDFQKLTENPSSFEGSPERRLKILIRTFFYEFFRLREIFAVFLKKLKKYNFLNQNDVHEMKHDFSKHFEDIIKIRNKMVHESFPWIGKQFYDLSVIEYLKGMDKFLVKKDLSRIYTTEDTLLEIYNELIPQLLVEAHYISRYINEVVANISTSIKKIATETNISNKTNSADAKSRAAD